MKKIISAGLASILAISALSTAAFAEDTTIVAEGILAKPAIKVTMPKSMAFVFNPYKLVVDAKGKVGTKITAGENGTGATLNDAYVVPSYIFDETTKNAGWIITNNTGAAIKAGIVAYSAIDANAAFRVLDVGAASSDVPAASSGKKALKVAIKATAAVNATGAYNFGDSNAVDIKVHKTAITADAGKSIMTKCAAVGTAPALDGDATAANKMPGSSIEIPSENTVNGAKVPGTLAIEMDTTNTSIVNPDSLSWAETDAPKITYIYAFDLAGGTT